MQKSDQKMTNGIIAKLNIILYTHTCSCFRGTNQQSF